MAKKIARFLDGVEYADAMDALKIARVLLPTPSSLRKTQKKKDDEEERESAHGDLVPADTELMKFSKAMAVEEP